MKLNTCFVPLLIQCFSELSALNILVVFHSPSRSHYFLGLSLSRALANAGHDVTLIAPYNESKLPENITLIQVGQLDEFKKEMNTKMNLFEMDELSPLFNLLSMSKLTFQWTKSFFDFPEIQALVNSNKSFDAVVLDEFGADNAKILAYHYKAPLVLYSSMGAFRWVNRLVGNPQPTSYIPDIFLEMSNTLNFAERAYNALFGIVSELLYYFYVLPSHSAIVKKHFPNAPDLKDILYNVSLVFTNSHESISQPVPTVPNMIGIGGIHISPPKLLPTDLKNFMDNAKEGVIYFSMGSNLTPSQMPKHIKDAIMKVLGNRRERVLWKWDDDSLENKPNNFMISKWFPQQGILAHPNCKLFISHGGCLSTTESISLGKPILAIPIYGDQKLNANRISAMKVGRKMPFSQINEENFKAVVDEILENLKYKKNAEMRSKLFHDRPIKPADLAVYWIEYIARYQGAPHLKVAGADLPFYQYLLLDVIAALLAGIILAIYIIKLFICRKQKQNSKKKGE